MADIARLERLRAAHRDDLFAVRRQIRNAERDIEHDIRRIAEIGKDIERRIPTSGDDFAMTVGGQSFAERKPAGRALMKEAMTLVHLQEENETTIATIGGFDLVFSGKCFENDEFEYDVALARTGAESEIDLALAVTPLGAVSRIEHVLGGFEDERSQYRFRLDDAERRLASYQTRQGGEFSFEDELAEKRRQLHEIENDLAEVTLSAYPVLAQRREVFARHNNRCSSSISSSREGAVLPHFQRTRFMSPGPFPLAKLRTSAPL